jgi:collagen type IV alpha
VNMKRSNLRAFALCLTTVCATSLAPAQDDTSTRTRTERPGAGLPATPGSSGLYGSPATPLTTRAGEPVRLSRLLNSSLKNQSGESLGQVQDIVMDPVNGQIQFAVISLNNTSAGTPGAGTPTTSGIGTSPTTGSSILGGASGGQLVAVPWRLVTSSGQGQFTATVDRTMLQTAPTFSGSAWPTMDSTWMQRVYSHFGTNPGNTGAPGTGTGTGTGLGNPSTPGVPGTPGTPDITPPGRSPTSPLPGTTPGTTPGTAPGTSPGGAGGGVK